MSKDGVTDWQGTKKRLRVGCEVNSVLAHDSRNNPNIYLSSPYDITFICRTS